MVDPTVADWLLFRQQQRSSSSSSSGGGGGGGGAMESSNTFAPPSSSCFTLDDRFTRASSYSPEPGSLLTSPSLLQHQRQPGEDPAAASMTSSSSAQYTSSGLVYLQRGIQKC